MTFRSTVLSFAIVLFRCFCAELHASGQQHNLRFTMQSCLARQEKGVYYFRFDPEHEGRIIERTLDIHSNFGDLAFYSCFAHYEFVYLQRLLPRKHDVVMDLGCGLGRVGVYLYKQLSRNHSKHIVFIDSNSGTTKYEDMNAGGTYDNLALTKRFIQNNGVLNYSLHDLAEVNLSALGKVDAVVSMYSVGLNLPIEFYINDLLKISHPHTVFVFGITDSPVQKANKFARFFKNVRFVEGPAYPSVRVSYLVLVGPLVQHIDNDLLWAESKDSKLELGHTAAPIRVNKAASHVCISEFEKRQLSLLSGPATRSLKARDGHFTKAGTDCISLGNVFLLYKTTLRNLFLDEDMGHRQSYTILFSAFGVLKRSTELQDLDEFGICVPPEPLCQKFQVMAICWHFVQKWTFNLVQEALLKLRRVPTELTDITPPFGVAILARMETLEDLKGVTAGDTKFYDSVQHTWRYSLEPWVKAEKFQEALWQTSLVQSDAKRQASHAKSLGFTPHFLLDGVLDRRLLRQVAKEIPDGGADVRGCAGRGWTCWTRNDIPTAVGEAPINTWVSAKNVMEDPAYMRPATRALYKMLHSEPWIQFLQNTFDIKEELIPKLHGAGIQKTYSGGYLKLHTDFNRVGHNAVHRRVNVFVYINPDWEERMGGHLEIWNKDITKCAARVLPVFGRVVAFYTTDFSVHGNPTPVNAPGNRSRRSISLYYYTQTRPANECRNDNCLHEHGPDGGLSPNCDRCVDSVCRVYCKHPPRTRIETTKTDRSNRFRNRERY